MKTKTMKNLPLPSFKNFTRPLVCIAVALMLIPASYVGAQGTSTLSNVLAQLSSKTQATADPTLESLGSELVAKSQSLNTSLAGDPGTQSELTGALQSLLGNKGPEAVADFQKLSAAKLTPEQMSLAKDIGHTGSAFLVQKNLGSLEGSQSDVATIVSSLHNGNYTAALPAIKKVSQNVNITPAQKDLLSSMAKKMMPGAGSLSDGLKSLPGFGH
jgi:hypothetical protein